MPDPPLLFAPLARDHWLDKERPNGLPDLAEQLCEVPVAPRQQYSYPGLAQSPASARTVDIRDRLQWLCGSSRWRRPSIACVGVHPLENTVLQSPALDGWQPR